VGSVDSSPAELCSFEFVTLLEPVDASKPLRSFADRPRQF